MTRHPVDKVLAKIAELKKENIYKGHSREADMNSARNHAFELCEILINMHILTEQFEEDEPCAN